MEKSLILKRLRATINKLQELPDEKFNYVHLISRSENGCCTVCCALGWYPKWFPEAGFTYSKSLSYVIGSHYGGLNYTAGEYHGLSLKGIKVLFYGGSQYKPEMLIHGFKVHYFLDQYTRQDVIFNFKHMYYLIKKYA